MSGPRYDYDEVNPRDERDSQETRERLEGARRRVARQPLWLRCLEERIGDFQRGLGSREWHEDMADRAFDAWLAREVQDRLREMDPMHAVAEDDFHAGTLQELIDRPHGPRFRVDGLQPWDGNMLVVAQRKTGKTTLALNYALALLTGQPFLDAFSTVPIEGRVCLLNFEVAAGQVTRWADEVGIPPDRFYLVNLRGTVNPLSHARRRVALAALLRDQEVDALIVDPFGAAFSGASQNDPGEVGRWLTDLDRFARVDVGAKDLVLTAHAGWGANTRARGASALEDWADTIVTLSRHERSGQRLFKAVGRDVDVAEVALRFRPELRTLTLASDDTAPHVAEGSREALKSAVLRAVAANPGVSGGGLEAILREEGLSFYKGEPGKVAQRAVVEGRLQRQDGPRGAILYFPAST